MEEKIKKNYFHKRVNSKNLQGSRWLLVVHGAYIDGSCPILEALKKEFETPKYTVAAIAYETGEHGIHPHWQVYFQTSERCTMKEHLANLLGERVGFHIEVCRGTRQANLNYVYAVEKQYQLGWVVYAKGHEVPQRYESWRCDNLLWLRDNMKPWQKEVVAKIKTRPSYRDILWIWEPEGEVGKSYLGKYLHYFHGAILTGGSGGDMKHAIARWRQITGHYPVTIIVDIARNAKRSVDYTVLQQMKNAMFFSGKYESGMVASLGAPHILVFSNYAPDTSRMSKDRWIICKIDPETQQLTPSISPNGETPG